MPNNQLCINFSLHNDLIKSAPESQASIRFLRVALNWDVYGNDSAVEMRLPLYATQTRNKLCTLRDGRGAEGKATGHHPACHFEKPATSSNREAFKTH